MVSKPNEGVVERLTLDQVVFSLTFFPQSRSGVILAVIDEVRHNILFNGHQSIHIPSSSLPPSLPPPSLPPSLSLPPSKDKRVYCVMRDGVLEVGVERGSDTPIILSGGTEITMATWQYLLISIELPVTSNGSVIASTAVGSVEAVGTLYVYM